jgi:hypothetical protein
MAPAESQGRAYRSKKQRPCDLCRSRKAQCRIQDQAAACDLCRRTRRECTFVQQPVRKTRVHETPNPDGRGTLNNIDLGTASSPVVLRDNLVHADAPLTWMSEPRVSEAFATFDSELPAHEGLAQGALPVYAITAADGCSPRVLVIGPRRAIC